MSTPLSISTLFQDSLSRTGRLIVPSLPFGLLFVFASGLIVWAAGALPEGGGGFLAFACLAFATLFAHSLFSAAMYRSVLPYEGRLLSGAWRLTLAWILVFVVAAIGGSIIVLFFSLIGASLGVATGEAGQEITDMTAQMRDSGTFWPLFAIFAATLFGVFWFAVRLMLFAGASAVRGQVHVFRTWYWTKGHFFVLAPLMLGLIVMPVLLLTWLSQSVASSVFDAPSTPFQLGLSTALVSLILLPSAWLGHGFAAGALAKLAPSETP
ncbi:MAG: hypothetical protein AAF996_07265 [Pseudomonadota bacterium]